MMRRILREPFQIAPARGVFRRSGARGESDRQGDLARWSDL